MSQPESNGDLSPLEIKFGWGLILILISEAFIGFLFYFIYIELFLLFGGIFFLIVGLITLYFFIRKRHAFKMPHGLGFSLFLIIILVFCLFAFEMLLISRGSPLLVTWYFFVLFFPWIGYLIVWTVLSQVQKK